MKKTSSRIVVLLLFTFHFQVFTFTCIAQTSNWLWVTGGCGAEDYGNSISLDSNGNCYVTGYFKPPFIYLGNDTLTGSTSYNFRFYIVKYDNSGNELWAKTVGGNCNSWGTGIKTDAHGNCYVTGYFDNSAIIIFGSDTLSSAGSSGPLNFFIAKYDSLGNVLWAKTANGTINQSMGNGPSINIDVNGNVYVTGTFGNNPIINTITFSNVILTGFGKSDIFIVKYDSSGNVLWAKCVGGSNNDFGTGISLDANGNSYITGYFGSTTLAFDSITVTNNSNGNSIIFVAKYDSLGNVIWAKSSGTYSCLKPSISIDANGNSYITGFFNTNYAVFGNITLTNVCDESIFIVKFDSLGNVVWAKSAGGVSTDSDEAHSIITDAKGNSYVTGFFQGMLTFGNTAVLTSTGSLDIFVAKYDSSGNVLWVQKAGGDDNDVGNGISIDANGNSYITGYCYSSYAIFGNSGWANCGNTNNSIVFVAKLKNVTIGITEVNNLANKVNVFPNPTNGCFILSVPPETKEIHILNSLGQIMENVTVDNQTILNFEIIKSGIYFIQIITDKETAIKKLIVVD